MKSLLPRLAVVCLAALAATYSGCGGGSDTPKYPAPPTPLVAPALVDGRAELPYRVAYPNYSVPFNGIEIDEARFLYVAHKNNGFYQSEQSFREAIKAAASVEYATDNVEELNRIAAQVNWGKEYVVFSTQFSGSTCLYSHIERVSYASDTQVVTVEYSEQPLSENLYDSVSKLHIDAATGNPLPGTCLLPGCGYISTTKTTALIVPAVPADAANEKLVETSLSWWMAEVVKCKD